MHPRTLVLSGLVECMELQGSPCGQTSQAPGDEAHEHARFEDELLPIDRVLVLVLAFTEGEAALGEPRHGPVKRGPKSVAFPMRCGVHGLAPLQDVTLASCKPTASASICEYRSSCHLHVGTKAATPKRTSSYVSKGAHY
jgi:hypothetical protein